MTGIADMGRRSSQPLHGPVRPRRMPPNDPAGRGLTRHHDALLEPATNADMTGARHASIVTVALERDRQPLPEGPPWRSLLLRLAAELPA